MAVYRIAPFDNLPGDRVELTGVQRGEQTLQLVILPEDAVATVVLPLTAPITDLRLTVSQTVVLVDTEDALAAGDAPSSETAASEDQTASPNIGTLVPAAAHTKSG